MADGIVAAEESQTKTKEKSVKTEAEDVKSKEPPKHSGIPEAVFVVCGCARLHASTG